MIKFRIYETLSVFFRASVEFFCSGSGNCEYPGTTVGCQNNKPFGTLIDRFIPSRRGSKVSIFIGAEVKGSKVSIFIGAEVPYLGLKSQYRYCIQLYLF